MKKRERTEKSQMIYIVVATWTNVCYEVGKKRKEGRTENEKKNLVAYTTDVALLFSIATSHFSPSHVYIHKTKGSRTTHTIIRDNRRKKNSFSLVLWQIFYSHRNVLIDLLMIRTWCLTLCLKSIKGHRFFDGWIAWNKDLPFVGFIVTKKNDIEMWKEEILIQNRLIVVRDKMSK